MAAMEMVSNTHVHNQHNQQTRCSLAGFVQSQQPSDKRPNCPVAQLGKRRPQAHGIEP